MRILSPGFAMSSVAVRPIGELPEYVLPSVGESQPGSICSFVNPSCLPTLIGNLPFGWWKTA